MIQKICDKAERNCSVVDTKYGVECRTRGRGMRLSNLNTLLDTESYGASSHGEADVHVFM